MKLWPASSIALWYLSHLYHLTRYLGPREDGSLSPKVCRILAVDILEEGNWHPTRYSPALKKGFPYYSGTWLWGVPFKGGDISPLCPQKDLWGLPLPPDSKLILDEGVLFLVRGHQSDVHSRLLQLLSKLEDARCLAYTRHSKGYDLAVCHLPVGWRLLQIRLWTWQWYVVIK
jgi:hypothetical protein